MMRCLTATMMHCLTATMMHCRTVTMVRGWRMTMMHCRTVTMVRGRRMTMMRCRTVTMKEGRRMTRFHRRAPLCELPAPRRAAWPGYVPSPRARVLLVRPLVVALGSLSVFPMRPPRARSSRIAPRSMPPPRRRPPIRRWLAPELGKGVWSSQQREHGVLIRLRSHPDPAPGERP